MGHALFIYMWQWACLIHICATCLIYMYVTLSGTCLTHKVYVSRTNSYVTDMPHAYGMCNTHEFICDMSHSCVSWFVHMCDMTPSCVTSLIHVWRALFIWYTWHWRIYMWYAAFMFVIYYTWHWRIHIWHASFMFDICIYVTLTNLFILACLIHVWHMYICDSDEFIYSCVPYSCLTWFVHTCDTSHSYDIIDCNESCLQHTATHCNTLQHTACTATQCTHCNTLQHSARTAAHCNTLHTAQHTATQCTHCNTLQHTAHTATHCNIVHTLQHTATHHSIRISCNCSWRLLWGGYD